MAIDCKELQKILSVMPSEQNLMLVGKHGIGKSEILTRFFERQGLQVVTLFLGQMSDPGDLIGLPRMDEQTGRTPSNDEETVVKTGLELFCKHFRDL